MPNETKLSGSCFCGAIIFETANPKWCANCHCSMCRHIHGAAFVTWVGFNKDQFSILKGKEHLKQHQSSLGASRGSCDICGSQMFFESERWPNEIHIARAVLPDESVLRPAAHYFFDDRAPWIQIEDTLPRYGGPTGTELIPSPTNQPTPSR